MDRGVRGQTGQDETDGYAVGKPQNHRRWEADVLLIVERESQKSTVTRGFWRQITWEKKTNIKSIKFIACLLY